MNTSIIKIVFLLLFVTTSSMAADHEPQVNPGINLLLLGNIDPCATEATVPIITSCLNADNACCIQAGDPATLVLQGDVLAPDSFISNGQVMVDVISGKILCVDTNCCATPGFATATKLICPSGVISPGLINPHDHIAFSYQSPVAHDNEKYDHRHEWRLGLNGHTKMTIGGKVYSTIRWNELRMLMSGVTSIAGVNWGEGLLRNLDNNGRQEGLSEGLVKVDTFPLGDAAGTMLDTGCTGYTITDPAVLTTNDSYLAHISEGISIAASNEFTCTSSTAGQDLVEANTAIIHAIGINANAADEIRTSKAKVIWSPRSNIDLYGATAPVTMFSNLGIPLALGTDWSISGSMNMLRELKCAADYNELYLSNMFSDKDLWKMATSGGALATETAESIGYLTPGRMADIVIYNGTLNTGYKAVIRAEPQDVMMVMRGGMLLYGESNIMEALGNNSFAGCESIDVCGTAKRICFEKETGETVAGLKSTLETSIGSPLYPLFFCGLPDGEPSCTQERQGEYDGQSGPTDPDADKVDTAADNCPDVFNPVRPMDGGVQADFDNDGVGDVCDPCPVNAGATVCEKNDADDIDRDSVLNPFDNCISVPNQDQADSDQDGIGDMCE